MDVRREPKIGRRGYANNVPELNSTTASLLKGESYYIGEKKEGTFLCNSTVAGASEEAGFNVEQEIAKECEAAVHSEVKLCSDIGKLIIARCSYIFRVEGTPLKGTAACKMFSSLVSGSHRRPSAGFGVLRS